MKTFYKDNKKTDLCLFFCGWGTDERLYIHLLNDYDYLLFFDYSDLDFYIPFDFSKYSNIYLVSYSAGVGIPPIIKDKLPNIKKNIAINGSINIMDSSAINKKAMEASKSVNSSNYIQFRKEYLTDSEEELKLFCENAPRRTFESCINEMIFLQEISKEYKNAKYYYDMLFTSKNDKFILSDIIRKEYEKFTEIEGAHFPFFRYKSLKFFIENS